MDVNDLALDAVALATLVKAMLARQARASRDPGAFFREIATLAHEELGRVTPDSPLALLPTSVLETRIDKVLQDAQALRG